MNYVKKQFMKAILKNKIFIVFMMLMSGMTSFMYFFVHFSIDTNLKKLLRTNSLSEAEQAYKQALLSNIGLARSMLIGFCALTLFVYGLFYYRLFKTQKRALGCIKQLGYTDQAIRKVFLNGSIKIHLLGSCIGLIGGYLKADLLIDANQRTYLVNHLVKGIGIETALIGICLPLLGVLIITWMMYKMIQGKETSLLMLGIEKEKTYSVILRFANQIASYFPKKVQMPIRLALRQPIAVCLVWLSVMMVSVMFILGYSLNISSTVLMESQLMGRYYAYDTVFDTPQMAGRKQDELVTYLEAPCKVHIQKERLEWKAVGIQENSHLFQLYNEDKKEINTPKGGQVIIPKQLQALYHCQKGESLKLSIGNQQVELEIIDIAYNGEVGVVYLEKGTLAKLLALPETAYIGVLSMNPIVTNQGKVTTISQRVEDLERNQVSNRVSAVINQIIGGVMGCILFFLALLLNFQSCSKEILILKGIGYENKKIRSMLINIYRPMIGIAFIVTLGPAIYIVKMILRGLSLQIGDYMMFQTNGYVIVGVFILLLIIYTIVQYLFQMGIRQMTQKESVEWQFEA